jgi:hypothetical protein
MAAMAALRSGPEERGEERGEVSDGSGETSGELRDDIEVTRAQGTRQCQAMADRAPRAGVRGRHAGVPPNTWYA